MNLANPVLIILLIFKLIIFSLAWDWTQSINSISRRHTNVLSCLISVKQYFFAKNVVWVIWWSNVFQNQNNRAFCKITCHQKPHRIGFIFYRFCNFFQSNDFQENEVDLEVALILQPLLRRNGKNVCDVPVIARQVKGFL